MDYCNFIRNFMTPTTAIKTVGVTEYSVYTTIYLVNSIVFIGVPVISYFFSWNLLTFIDKTVVFEKITKYYSVF